MAILSNFTNDFKKSEREFNKNDFNYNDIFGEVLSSDELERIEKRKEEETIARHEEYALKHGAYEEKQPEIEEEPEEIPFNLEESPLSGYQRRQEGKVLSKEEEIKQQDKSFKKALANVTFDENEIFERVQPEIINKQLQDISREIDRFENAVIPSGSALSHSDMGFFKGGAESEGIVNLKKTKIGNTLDDLYGQIWFYKMENGSTPELDKSLDMLNSFVKKYGDDLIIDENQSSVSKALTGAYGITIPYGQTLVRGKKEIVGGALLGTAKGMATSTLDIIPGDEMPVVLAETLFGAGVGFKTALAKNFYIRTAGNTYKELLQEGVRDEYAKPMSMLAGVAEALSEQVELGMASKAGNKIVSVALKENMEKKIGKVMMTKMAVAFGENWIAEALQEGGQDILTDTCKKFAEKSENEARATEENPDLIDSKTNKEILFSGIKTAIDSLWATWAFPLGGASMQASKYAINQNIMTKNVDSMETFADFVVENKNNIALEDINNIVKAQKVIEKTKDADYLSNKNKEKLAESGEKINTVLTEQKQKAEELSNQALNFKSEDEAEIEELLLLGTLSDLETVRTDVNELDLKRYKVAEANDIKNTILEMKQEGKSSGEIVHELINKKKYRTSVAEGYSMVNSVIKINDEILSQSLMNIYANQRRATDVIREIESVQGEEVATTEEVKETKEIEQPKEVVSHETEVESQNEIEVEKPVAKEVKESTPEQITEKFKSDIVALPIKDILVDAKRFQFRTETDASGVTKKLAEVDYNPNFAGVITVWEDEYGDRYVINGHHRLELAQRSNAESINARIISSEDYTDEEAKGFGALLNIAEGNATAIDIAKVLKTNDTGKDIFKEYNIPTTQSKVKQGIELAKLNGFLFTQVATKQLSVNRGVLIGKIIDDKDMQVDAYKMINKQEQKGKRLNLDTIESILRTLKSADMEEYEQTTLFGEETMKKSLAVPKAELETFIKNKLKNEKKLLSKLDANKNIEYLEKLGNKINIDENLKNLSQAEQILDAIDKMAYYKGTNINTLLNEQAKRLEAGENVKQETFDKIVKLYEEGKIYGEIGDENNRKSSTRSTTNDKERRSEDTNGQTSFFSIKNEERVKNQPIYEEIKDILEASKKNKFLGDVEVIIKDKKKFITLNREEMDNSGYKHQKEGRQQVAGYTKNYPDRSEILLYVGSSKDTISEEIIHALQARLLRIDPTLQNDINTWEQTVIKEANEYGIAIPEGYELFAQAFIFGEMGYADSKEHKYIADLISIPDDIVSRFSKILGNDLIEAMVGDIPSQIAKENRLLKGKELRTRLDILKSNREILTKMIDNSINDVKKSTFLSLDNSYATVEKLGKTNFKVELHKDSKVETSNFKTMEEVREKLISTGHTYDKNSMKNVDPSIINFQLRSIDTFNMVADRVYAYYKTEKTVAELKENAQNFSRVDYKHYDITGIGEYFINFDFKVCGETLQEVKDYIDYRTDNTFKYDNIFTKTNNINFQLKPVKPIRQGNIFTLSDEEYEKQKAKDVEYKKEFTKFVTEIIHEDGVFSIGDGSHGQFIMVHPYTKGDDYKYQSTWFDKNSVPLSDHVSKNIDDVVNELFLDGFDDVDSIKYLKKPLEPAVPTSEAWQQGINAREMLRRYPDFDLNNIPKSNKFEKKLEKTGALEGRKVSTDYNVVGFKNDVVISEGVIDMLPQDTRDNFVRDIAESLRINGSAYITVNKNTNDYSMIVNEANKEVYNPDNGKYHKEFEPNELLEYFLDVLDKNYEVELIKDKGVTGVKVSRLANETYRKTPTINYQLQSSRQIGVHYGDLGVGKDTTLQSMTYGRSTGHFGTGTYFLNEALKDTSGYTDRPKHNIDLSKYDLLRVTDNDFGYNLHRYFKIANELAYENLDEQLIKDLKSDYSGAKFISTISQFRLKKHLELDAKINKLEETAEESGKSYEEYEKEVAKLEEDFKTLKNILKDLEDLMMMSPKLRWSNSELSKISEKDFFDTTFDKISELHEILENTSSYKGGRENEVTFANRFLGEFGFDGVDVRGTKLDNTSYGSVIFSDDRAKSKIKDESQKIFYQLNIPHINFTGTDKTDTLSFPETIAKADISEDLKELLNNNEYSYMVKSNTNTFLSALKYLDDVGIEKATDEVLDLKNVGTAELFALAQTIVAYRMAEGNTWEAERVIENVSVKAKDLGQAIQALRMWGMYTPAGIIRYAKKAVKGSMSEKDDARLHKIATELEHELNKINRETAKDVDVEDALETITKMSDGEILTEKIIRDYNEAKRKRTNKGTKAKPRYGNDATDGSTGKRTKKEAFNDEFDGDFETPKGEQQSFIKNEVDTFKGDSYDTASAEETAQKLADRIKKTTVIPEAKEEKTPLELMVDTLYQVAKESPLPNHNIKEVKDPLKIVAEAIRYKGDYRAIWNKAKLMVLEQLGAEKNVRGINELLDYFDKSINRTFPNKELSKAIKSELKKQNVKIKEVVVKHYSEMSGLRTSLVDALVNDAGVTEMEAEILERNIRRQMKDMTKEAKEKLLASKFKPKLKNNKTAQQTATDKIIEMSNLGAFRNDKYKNLVAEKLGMPSLSEEDLIAIHQQAQYIQTLKTDSREKEIEVARLHEMISSKQKHDFLEYVDFAQTLAQLLNPKTAIRNVGGNLGFGLVETLLTDSVKVPIDMAFSKISGQRTAKFMPAKKMQASISGFKEGWEKGLYDALNHIDTTQHTTRFDIPSSRLYQKGVMGTLETALNISLRATDRAFYESAVNEALMEMKEIMGTDKVTDEMIETAHYVGLYRTFQDDTILAQKLSSLKKSLNYKGKFGIGSMILKYPKTPANLLMRSIDYSPAGLTIAIIKLFGESTGNQYLNQKMKVDALARGFVGSSIFAIGAIMLKLGMISSKNDDDYDIYKTKLATGLRQYQLNVSLMRRILTRSGDYTVLQGDKLSTYDWFQPLAVTIAMGVDFAKNMQTNEEKGKFIFEFTTQLIYALQTGTDTLTNQSLLQGLTNVLKRDSPAEMLVEVLAQVPSSFVPTLFSQVQILVDPTVYQTYVKDDILQTSLNKAYKKVPIVGVKKLEPTIDQFGNVATYYDETQKNWIWRTIDTFLNPAITSTYSATENEQMLIDLYKSTDETLHVPNSVKWKYKLSGNREVRLTAREYRVMSEWVGKRIDEQFTKEAQYMEEKDYSDERKVEILHRILIMVNRELNHKLEMMANNKELNNVVTVEE